jgi:soluble lytic murein transglycosylase-like protein
MLSAVISISSISCINRSTTIHPDLDTELLRLATLSEKDIPSVLQNLDREDEIAIYYRDPATRPAVLVFFTELTGSETVAKAVLDNAARTGVPTALAFALAYEESRFQVKAYNDNGTSVDRGLFQLNSKTFPNLKINDFYDPNTNTRHGISHLDYCLRAAGNEVAALAMYNAGQGRVSGGGTPKATLDYIYRIMKYQENIGSLFAARVVVRSKFSIASIGGH